MKLGKIRVIIVDDNRHMRESLKEAIEAIDGFEVMGTAASVEEGTGLVRTNPVEVVLLDLEMPYGEALLAAKAINEIDPKIRIIGLCVFADSVIRQAARLAGAVLLVEKVLPAKVILEKISIMLKKVDFT